ncbi:ATP-binding protein [Roseivivax lentus]|nr:ATP-binding protein [Roseivivax lentus]
MVLPPGEGPPPPRTQPDADRAWHYEIGPRPRQVSLICVRVDADLRIAGYAPDIAASMALVCAEALNNIVEHALPGRSDGWITLEIDPAPPCRLTFRDNGAPLPDGLLLAGPGPDLSGERRDLAEGGYGWLLIRSFAESVAYTRLEEENVLQVTLRMSG